MESLNSKRSRLRGELQQAYDAWIDVSEAGESAAAAPVDISGSPTAAKAHWFAYLAAKQRLVLAYAEQRLQAA
jgi:hypothetical protein